MTDVADKDPLQLLFAEIEGARARIRRIDPTLGALKAQMDGTVLSLLGDLVKAVAQLRDGTYEMMVDLDERVGAVEGDTTSFAGEDAEKFKALAESAEWVAKLVLDLGTQNEQVTAKLRDVIELAKQCRQIVDEAVIHDDEDDEDDEDEGEELPS